MADEKDVTGVGGPEAAEVKEQPANVVTDNTGVIPVQPVATSDPTINDNTNPKVAFDGADPRNIPPHDSNEQLHISAAKRAEAEGASVTDESTRREAVEAAYDVKRDVRDVLPGAEAPGEKSREDNEDVSAADRRAAAVKGARTQPPAGRQGNDPRKVRA